MHLIRVTAELVERYERLAAVASDEVRRCCPGLTLDIQHVGATSVPGLLTKGDLDVIVRVDGGDFGGVVAALEEHFTCGPPENWMSGESAAFALPPLPVLEGLSGAVQVIRVGGTYDIFLRVRDLLRQHGRWRDEMNSAKLSAQGWSAGPYRARKELVYQRLLAWMEQDAAGRDWFDFWEHYRPEPATPVAVRLLSPTGQQGTAVGVYRTRTVVPGEEDGEVVLADGRLVSSDTPVRVVAWTPDI